MPKSIQAMSSLLQVMSVEIIPKEFNKMGYSDRNGASDYDSFVDFYSGRGYAQAQGGGIIFVDGTKRIYVLHNIAWARLFCTFYNPFTKSVHNHDMNFLIQISGPLADLLKSEIGGQDWRNMMNTALIMQKFNYNKLYAQMESILMSKRVFEVLALVYRLAFPNLFGR